MEISSDTAKAKAKPSNQRRALLVRHDPAFLADPQVSAFLDDKITDWDCYTDLVLKFVVANEPALLVELVQACGAGYIIVAVQAFGLGGPHSLPAGFLDHVLQRLGAMPTVEALTITGADLSAHTCDLLQTALQDPHSSLVDLTFNDCHLVGANVRFPTQALKVTDFLWRFSYTDPSNAALWTALLPSLAGWSRLASIQLYCGREPMNFAALTQLLQVNPSIKLLGIVCLDIPSPAAHPAPDPQLNPFVLVDAVKHNRTRLTELHLCLQMPLDPQFDSQLVLLMADCMRVNTTLEMLYLPGIEICTAAALQQFKQALWNNHTLIELDPTETFAPLVPSPITRNRITYFRFTPEFVIGAAEAFVRLMGVPREIGTLVGSHMASTSIDRMYCGPVMALVCKATHTGAVRLRSACLRDALIAYIRINDEESCKKLITSLVEAHVDLLPADKAAVVAEARQQNRLNCLPAGYAG